MNLYTGVQGSADEAAAALAAGSLNDEPNARYEHQEHHGGNCEHVHCAELHCLEN